MAINIARNADTAGYEALAERVANTEFVPLAEAGLSFLDQNGGPEIEAQQAEKEAELRALHFTQLDSGQVQFLARRDAKRAAAEAQDADS